MKPIRTVRLILRNWEDRDRDLFERINSDDRVMEFFPFRRDRAQSDALMDQMRDGIAADGFGFAAIEVAQTGKVAGFAGITRTDDMRPHMPLGAIEIGWRMAPEFWGQGIVTEAAKAWLDFGFDELELPVIWSFAVASNHRSLAVMQRIGMTRIGDFDYSAVPDTHPALKRHDIYRIGRETWKAQ